MNNIQPFNGLQTISSKTDLGIVTTLTAKIGISERGSIAFGDKTLLANYVYDRGEDYKLVYTVIDVDGNAESFADDEGILPTLFLSPGGENYVSVIPYHPTKELEISIPVFNRGTIELPKANKPFLGDYIGISNQYSIFFYADIWSEKQPDKMEAIEFKDGMIIKKHTVKIPLPRNNKIFIADNEIHLLTTVENGWLHRQIDELGNIKNERQITSSSEFFWQILSLSFEEESYILCEENGKISVEIITVTGDCRNKELIDIGDEFFNTWQPEKIGDNTSVTRFNGEFGNGWLTTKNDELLEIFYNKDTKGYRNLITDEVLELQSDLIISGLNKTADNAYAVVFYPMTDDRKKKKNLFVLNKAI
ncbi:hypothetical protein [Chryseobacterium sp. NFX27]|uniref:hypothetical protein n=1 Tax=Chryseobacterium sp. NFX27 TaxID=2819618 RepID=UPI003CE72982